MPKAILQVIAIPARLAVVDNDHGSLERHDGGIERIEVRIEEVEKTRRWFVGVRVQRLYEGGVQQ